MQDLLRSARLFRRHVVGFIGSASTPPALARRDAPRRMAILAAPLQKKQPPDPISRVHQPYIRVESEKRLSKDDYSTMGFKPSSMGPIEEKMQRGMVGRLIEDDTASPPIGRAAKDEVTESCTVGTAVTDDVTDSSPIGRAAKDEVTESGPTAEAYQLAEIHPWSHHRDGTIYKNMIFWKSDQCIDVTNRDETQLEPMRFTVATNDCYIDAQDCLGHLTCDMLQIFSLNLAKTTIKSGPIQLYGYIAARDDVDFMLNYVCNRSRDDPIIVQQGSFIEVTGPKRGIQMNCSVLFEFDVRIRNEKKGEDDLQLIDGGIVFIFQWR